MRRFTKKWMQREFWHGRRHQFRQWLRDQKTQNYLKAVLSCSIASVIMFIRPFRFAIGTMYFQVLITTALAHGGMTIGANLELQLQQLSIASFVAMYILFIQAVVYGLGQTPNINFEVAAKLTRAFGLAVYCFFVALLYAYTPRLNLAMKINISSGFIAFTNYPLTRKFQVKPLPGVLYAQLVGAGISTLVNVFVMPSTSSRKLVGALRTLLKQMEACCEYFDKSAAGLGLEALGKRDGTEDAKNLRILLRGASERFGQVVGGSRYETTIERFSQLDYQQIFIQANKLASSFGTMCLPFEIDDDFYYHLQDPSAKMQHGSMAKSSSRVSLASFSGDHPNRHSSPTRDHGNKAMGKSLVKVADMHWRQELSRKGVVRTLIPIKAQLSLHSHILRILIDRTKGAEHGSPTKSLFCMVSRSIRFYTKDLEGDIGHSVEGVVDIDDIVPEDLAVDNAEMNEHLRGKLERMSLGQMAEVVNRYADKYEQAEAECIKIIAPYGLHDDAGMHEQHVVLLSFIGSLRENAVCLSNMLQTLHRIDAKRPDRMQVWFPKLNWSWLYYGRIDDDEEKENDIDIDTDHMELENAFSTYTRFHGKRSKFKHFLAHFDFDSDSDSDSDSDKDPSLEPQYEQQLRSEGLSVTQPTASPAISGIGTGTGTGSGNSRSDGATPASSSLLSPSPLIGQQDLTQTSAIYKTIDTSAARIAHTVLSWLQRPKTRYAIKFTVTLMVWSIWSFIGVSEKFFSENNAVWGMSCIGAVLGVTIGSTIHAGVIRVLAVSLAGSWAIVAWISSNYGTHAYLPCFCCIIYFVVSFYLSFFTKKLAPVAPVMAISFSSVLFIDYFKGRKAEGATLGWKHVAVNAAGIGFAFVVSALFMPYKARTALRRALAEVLQLNSLIVQSINHMHMARAEFPAVHRNERRRVEKCVYRSRVLISKCRNLVPAAEREPSLHEWFQSNAHCQLIDTLELQLEWLMYSSFTHTSIDVSGGNLAMMIRLAMAMRDDIVGAKSAFNSILASALHAKIRLPAYLPDIGTARQEFMKYMHPLMKEQYTKSFAITYLARWNVGIWHVIGSQTDLCLAVHTIVGAETDNWPEEVGFMLDSLEVAPPGQTSAAFAQDHIDDQSADNLHSKDRWFSRLPKYAS